MTRLPQPGGDPDNWGTILNDFLSAAHNTDGSLKQAGDINQAKADATAALASASTALHSGDAAGGDLSGTYPNPTVAKLQSVTLSGTPSSGQVITAASASSASWQTPAAGATLSNASPTALGTAAAGSSSQVTRADHVHPTTGLALATNGGAENIVNINGANGSVQLDLANGNVFNVTVTGDVSFTFTGAASGKAASFSLYLSQDSTGGHNISWPGGVLWPDGTIPTLTAAANAVDILVFESLTGTTWFGGLVGLNYS